MIINQPDAIALLRGWQDESTPVGLVTKFEGVDVSLHGLVKIDAGSPDFFFVELPSNRRWKRSRARVPLHGSPQFDYSDVREASPAIREHGVFLSALRLDWPGLRIVIFELAPDDSVEIPDEA